VSAKKADFNAWSSKFNISPVLARILRNRDLTQEWEIEKFLYGKQEDCYAPWLLKDMDKSVEALLEAVREKVFIRVIGDYDVDGICASYILTKGLKVLGAVVDTAIPHRIHDGYGLNDNLIEEAHRDGVGMIVTCDNGIAAAEQIALANSYGIRVIVTDHHEVPFVAENGERKEMLPPALAVIDPEQEACDYPFPGICGGVVAYKLVSALAEKTGLDMLKETLEELLEFAALSTVCDVMELKDENRIIVKEGLQRLRQSRNIGLKALMEVNEIEPAKLNAYHLGFVIGPCLNATGRLDTAKRALDLFCSNSYPVAYRKAVEMKEWNQIRKDLTEEGTAAAIEQVEQAQWSGDNIYVIYLPDVHESLAGIIAGRIRERYNKPAIVLTKSVGHAKGSARSIEAYNMYEELSRCKDLLLKFGGHPMAAGMSLNLSDVEEFRRRLNRNCTLTKEDIIPKIVIDVVLPLGYVTEELCMQLEALEPFGSGNEKPLFAERNLRIRRATPIGKTGKYFRFLVENEYGSNRLYRIRGCEYASVGSL